LTLSSCVLCRHLCCVHCVDCTYFVLFSWFGYNWI